MRRGFMLIGLTGICALLAACATTGAGSSGGAASATTSTSAPPNILALTGNDTSAQTASICGGVFGASGGPQIVYKVSDTLYVEAVYALSKASYPLPLPDSQPLQPWPLPAALDSDQLNQELGGDPNVNPDLGQGAGILFTVCNAGAQSLTLTGAQAIVADFIPVQGALNIWNPCDGAFTRPDGVTGDGCGGAIIPDETMSVSFATGAGINATAQAAQVDANGQNGFGPLPVTLKSGGSIMLDLTVTPPSAMGTYEFAVSVASSVAGGTSALSAYAPLPPQILAQATHKYTGAACATSAMQAQIPTKATNPATYYICPES